MDWTHDRAHVRLLHQAHADHIESMYRGMLALPGNPAGVVIRQFGQTRTFVARGNRLENRAIFTGEESHDEIDAVLRHFIEHQSNLVIELNPANYYVNPPATWEKRLLKRLLMRGCRIEDFRCVWCRAAAVAEVSPANRVARFGTDQLDEYIELARQVEPRRKWGDEDRASVSQPGWFHYVGFADDRPCAVGTLFISGKTGYLAWWYTHPEYRGRGLQQAGILRRLRDAQELGCERVFTVTDFNFSSPANLQRCGLQLAYNYLLLRRDPVPLEVSHGDDVVKA